MTEDSPIYNTETLVITTDTGVFLSCAPYTFRMIGGAEDCWRLIDTSGATHKGPRFARGASHDDVQQLVSAWWATRA